MKEQNVPHEVIGTQWWYQNLVIFIYSNSSDWNSHKSHINIFSICFVSIIHHYNMNIHPQKNLDLEVLINDEIVWTMNLIHYLKLKKNDQQFFLHSQMNNKFAKKSLLMMAKKMIEFGEKLSRDWKMSSNKRISSFCIYKLGVFVPAQQSNFYFALILQL